MSEYDVFGPDSIIEVAGDETPVVLTAVITESSRTGEQRLFTARGERAGMNLMDLLTDAPDETVVAVRSMALADLALHGNLKSQSGLSLYR